MQDTISIQMGQRGVLTLPKALRDLYSLQSGDDFTLLDLGGVFVLRPHPAPRLTRWPSNYQSPLHRKAKRSNQC